MALSASSVLHYWSSRFGPVPIVGGKPTHSRNSVASWVDQKGEVQTSPINTPRSEWATIDSERRPVMRLEPGGTFSVLHSADFTSGSWVNASLTVAAGKPDPSGGTAANRLTCVGTNGNLLQTLSAGASIVRTNSLWVRRVSGSGLVGISNPDNSAWVTIAVTTSWQRFSTTGLAGTVRKHGILVQTPGDVVEVWGAQQDDGLLTSYVATVGSPVARSADSFDWDFILPPQGMMAYLRFVERGTVGIAGGALMQLGDVLANDPKLLLYAPAGVYRVFHNNGVSSVLCDATAAPSYGVPVEIVALLQPGGQVGLIQSVNGAAATQNANSGPLTLASHWAGTKLTLGCIGTGNTGAADFIDVKLVNYADVVATTAQGIVDELRAFTMNAAGEVLA